MHHATVSVAVMDGGGKLIMECILETKAATILEFIQGVRGTLSLTFEEGTSAAWLHDLLKPHVSRLVVCDPRKAALLKEGNKSDRIDARKLAELLRGNQLSPVYHGDHGVRTLKESGRCYLTITKDITRVMSRIKALYRSWAIPLQRHHRLCCSASRRVVGQDSRTRSSSPGRTIASCHRTPRLAASASAAKSLSSSKNCGDWPMKSPMAVKKLTTPMAIPLVSVGRMTETIGSFRLRNGQGSGMIRLVLKVSPPKGVALRSGNTKPFVGSVKGGALPALSCFSVPSRWLGRAWRAILTTGMHCWRLLLPTA